MAELFDDKAIVKKADAVDLMAQVISQPDSEVKLQVLKELIALQNAQLDRQAKLDFDRNFMAMREELKPVVRCKENEFLHASYAPLDAMQDICDPIIHKHGFSYSWREEPAEGGKTVLMDVTGYGHTRTNSFFCPTMDSITSRDGKKVTNVLQNQGIMSTYGQRYTFKAGFGIKTKDTDTDGNVSLEIDDAMQAYRDKIDMASNLEELSEAYREAFGRYKDEADKKALVIGWYNIAKAKFKESK